MRARHAPGTGWRGRRLTENCCEVNGSTHGKHHTLGIVYSFFLIRMYVSFRQEVSKGGFPTSRVYLRVHRQKGVSFARGSLRKRLVCRSDPILSTPWDLPGRGNTLGIGRAVAQTATRTVRGSCPLKREAGIQYPLEKVPVRKRGLLGNASRQPCCITDQPTDAQAPARAEHGGGRVLAGSGAQPGQALWRRRAQSFGSHQSPEGPTRPGPQGRPGPTSSLWHGHAEAF